MIEKVNFKTNYKIFWILFALLISILIIFKLFNNKIAVSSIDYVSAIENKKINKEQLIVPYKIDSKPLIYAESVILLDADSKYVLYEKNSNNPEPIASTTKLLTSLVVLDSFKFDDVLKVDQRAASINGSQMFLNNGEEMTVKNLLKGLLVVSGNDAAYTFAQNYVSDNKSGFEAFVEAMNEKVKSLNLKNSHMIDPAGLDDNALTSAKDLAVIASEFIKYKELTDITKISEEVITDTSNMYKHTLKNSNRLVMPQEQLYMSEAIGLKTGFTGEAGHCLVSAIEYKNRRLISVVLNTTNYTPPASAEESYKLLNWGKKQIDIVSN